jgi:hypothetical protein
MSANFLGMEINSKKTQTPDEEWQKNKGFLKEKSPHLLRWTLMEAYYLILLG